MLLVDRCCEKVFGYENEQFNIDSHYPLVIADDTFAIIDKGDFLSTLFGRYCSNHYIIKGTSGLKNSIIEAKAEIKAKLLPLTLIKLNYCFITYYSIDNRSSINDVLQCLSSVERDISYSDEYKVSIIVVIDSRLKCFDEQLKDFLTSIQRLNSNFEVFAFTCDYGHDKAKLITENHEALMGSVVGAVLLRSHVASINICNENEKKARNDIDFATKGLNLGDKAKLRWQSAYAKFGDKRRDFVAYALNVLFENVATLSVDRVVEEAAKIDVPLESMKSLQNFLTKSVNSIPTVVAKSKIKFPKNYSFDDVCKRMFGDEGYLVAEISCKTTFANCLKVTTNEENYVQRARELISKASTYRHDDLMGVVVKGVDSYIALIQDEISEAANKYHDFIYKQFDSAEHDFEDILDGYVKRFLKREELSTKFDYWKALRTKFSQSMIPEYSEIVGHVTRFSQLKKELEAHQYGYTYNSLLNEMKGYTMKMALGLPDNEEFLRILRELCNKYIENATEKEFIINWSFALSFLPEPTVSRTRNANIDFGRYQIKGSQLFSEYWEFK